MKDIIFGIGKEKDIYKAIEERRLILPDISYECRVKNFLNLRDKPDYLFIDIDTGKKIFLEVKPWELKIRDMQQLLKYLVHIQEEGRNRYGLAVLCYVIKKNRKEILEKLGVRVYTSEDCIIR